MPQCYACDKPCVSTEHVPPQSLFPEPKDLPSGIDLRKNLITVPDCEEHNLEKAGEDEYLLFTLVVNIGVNSEGLRQWQTKIRRALAKRPTKYRLFKNARPVRFLGIPTGAYDIDIGRLSRQFELIARGTYYYHFKRRWPHEIQVAIPLAVGGSAKAKAHSQVMRNTDIMAARFLEHEPDLGENPAIFKYRYKVSEDGNALVIRMVFYGGIPVTAISNAGSQVVQGAN